MGVVIRSPTSHKIEKDNCRCFILEKDNYLCFRRNFSGALSDEQEQKYCTPKSFVPEKQGGFAKESDSQESKNILRTIGMFTKGVKVAKKEYEESGERSIPYWQNVVKHKVDEVYLHPGGSYHQSEKVRTVKSEKVPLKTEIREEVTKIPDKTSEKPLQITGMIDWEGNKRRRMEKEKHSLPTKVTKAEEEPDERQFITPETIRALTEAKKKALNRTDVEAIEHIVKPIDDYRYDRAERMTSLLDYRYNKYED